MLLWSSGGNLKTNESEVNIGRVKVHSDFKNLRYSNFKGVKVEIENAFLHFCDIRQKRRYLVISLLATLHSIFFREEASIQKCIQEEMTKHVNCRLRWGDIIHIFRQINFSKVLYIVVISEIYSHWKNISSNHLFSNFFSKHVAFTKFLPKMRESKFPKLPHCECHTFLAKISWKQRFY